MDNERNYPDFPSGDADVSRAYTTLRNAVSADVQALYDSVGLTSHSVRVRNSSTQTVTGDTPAALTFNTETFDYGGFWASSPNPTRLTVPTGGAGIYHVTGAVTFDDAAADNTRRVLLLYKNGSYTGKLVELSRDTSEGYGGEVSDDIVLADADYLEVKVQTGVAGDTVLSNAIFSMSRSGVAPV